MRLLTLLALAGCYTEPAPVAPSNKVPAPDKSVADDVLAYLPVDSELVVGIDGKLIRGSQLWTEFQQQSIPGLADTLEKFRQQCGFDPLQQIHQISIGAKQKTGNEVDVVFVVRGVDGTKLLACIEKEAAKDGPVTNDGGVLVMKNKSDPDESAAAIAVGRSTVILHRSLTASRASLDGLIASGSPLRTSRAFLGLYERLEPSASVWFIGNGRSKMFDSMTSMGARPKSLDGTLRLTSSFTFAARMNLASPDEATQVVTSFSSFLPSARAMLQKLDVRANGARVEIDAVMTSAQAKSLMGMFGGLMP